MMGLVNFDTDVVKTVDITKTVDLNVSKTVEAFVNIDGKLATAEASADAVGGGNGPGNGIPPSSDDPLAVTPNTDANALADEILGPGVERTSPATFIGGNIQGGTFTDGGDIGLQAGIVFSSGDVSELEGFNANIGLPEIRGDGGSSDNPLSTDVGTPGDPDVADAVDVDVDETFDAAGLEFDFQLVDAGGMPTSGDISFRFVFGSEEYIDFIESDFNDAFVLLIDGVNLAEIGGDPISVNTVNDQENADAYRNNIDGEDTDGTPIPSLDLSVQLDGLTTVLTASITGLDAGPHNFKVAVADVSDAILDAAVFIEKGSFTSISPPSPTLAETDTFAQVSEDGAFAFSESLAASSGPEVDMLIA